MTWLPCTFQLLTSQFSSLNKNVTFTFFFSFETSPSFCTFMYKPLLYYSTRSLSCLYSSPPSILAPDPLSCISINQPVGYLYPYVQYFTYYTYYTTVQYVHSYCVMTWLWFTLLRFLKCLSYLAVSSSIPTSPITQLNPPHLSWTTSTYLLCPDYITYLDYHYLTVYCSLWLSLTLLTTVDSSRSQEEEEGAQGHQKVGD